MRRHYFLIGFFLVVFAGAGCTFEKIDSSQGMNRPETTPSVPMFVEPMQPVPPTGSVPPTDGSVPYAGPVPSSGPVPPVVGEVSEGEPAVLPPAAQPAFPPVALPPSRPEERVMVPQGPPMKVSPIPEAENPAEEVPTAEVPTTEVPPSAPVPVNP